MSETETASPAQQAFSEIDARWQKSASEIASFTEKITAEEQTIAGLQTQYDSAVKSNAAGNTTVDAYSIHQEIDRRGHRIIGLQRLRADLNPDHDALTLQRSRAFEAVEAELQDAEYAKLASTVSAAEKVMTDFRGQLNTAEADVRAAIQARDAFSRARETKRWRQRAGLE